MKAASELLLIDAAERDLSKIAGMARTLALNAPNSRKGSYQELASRLEHDIEELANTRKELERESGTDC